MLGKLLKHEFKATGRLFLPLFGAILILTPILALIGQYSRSNEMLQFFSALSIGTYLLLLVVGFAASFVLIVFRFYRSVTGDDAYLTFTLPVTTNAIIASKLIVAYIWQVVTVIVFGFSGMLYTFAYGIWESADLNRIWESLQKIRLDLSGYEHQVILLGILCILILIVSPLSGTLQIYASIGLGQTMKSHRVLSSFGFYMAIYTVIQTITSVILMPLIFLNRFDLESSHGMLDYMNFVFGLSIGIQIVMIIVFYFVTVLTFKKKLNLE